ncbi:CHAT domain-containing protein [Russula earlei]|uniref:CHAT domain-containing protein n=1 Tax=Russula earlei TaxID=71964 RepID=A0ACC0TWJ6_9AGAM|nr:CHAT domain-containing protein [Russula earlei]
MNIVEIFFHITVSFYFWSLETMKPEDVKWCVRSLRYLDDLPLEAFNLSRSVVTGFLVVQLALEMGLDSGDVTLSIEERANLCRELLNSDIPKRSLTVIIVTLADSVHTHFAAEHGIGRRVPSEKVVECLREANKRLPDLQLVSIALAESLLERFDMALLNDDYEEAMVILDKLIVPDERPSEFKGIALRLVARFAELQANQCGKPEYLGKEICRFQTLLSGASLEDPLRPDLIEGLAYLEWGLDQHFCIVARLRDPRSAFRPNLPPIPLFRDLSASLSQSQSRPTMMGSMESEHHLYCDHITEMADIEEAIQYHRLALASSSHPRASISGDLATLTGTALGEMLHKAFLCTNNLDHLNESISVLRNRLTITVESWNHFILAVRLCEPLLTRFRLLHHEEDLNEMMQLYQAAVNNERALTPRRLNASCLWAQIAHKYGHPCTSTAYDTAISLMQDSLAFAPTLETQHFRLVAVSDYDKVLPLDYASHLIRTGRLEKAIEIIDQGRALLWSEMRGLPYPQLADKFAAVNGDLETVTLNADGGRGNGGPEYMDRIGFLLFQQRTLLDDRDNLISQAPSFDTLKSAALYGPVIIVNHSGWRSDILMLLHDSPPSLITTSDDFFDRAIELRDRLLNCRTSKKHGLDSKQYQRVLRSILGGLYDLVGRPVIGRLRSLNVPEQSRVWWCPTSVFCSLPLHAMGPIPSSDSQKRYFSDLYIPSYTPTLSALIESRRPKIWAIQQLKTKVTTLVSNKATPSAVVESLRDHRFSHFVCHGKLQHGKPFDASFQLHDGQQLTLLDLIRSQLPTAEFAFLSACHTAELTEGSISDEALHLTAAMQYCGFRSVTGTLWGMADSDGPDLVSHFYKRMFSSKRAGTPYYERSAEALRDAVQGLRRKKGVSLERWVNFVHYGA